MNKMKISFTMLLGLLFIGLKLCNQIDWSWWWVTSPFWLPLVIFLGIITVVTLLTVICQIAILILARK